MTDTQKAFIEKIAALAVADFKTSKVLPSVTIAQAILESGWGTTVLATEANNLFGMKCSLSGNTWESCWDGVSAYNKETKEEYTVGNITTITAAFRKYPDISYSIKDHSLYLTGARNGSSLRYKGLTETTSYIEQITIIKNGGYATDSEYISKICNLIELYELNKYDKISDTEEVIAMSNSSLVTYTKISPNRTSPRNHKIDTITIHCVVGQLTAAGICGCFTSPSRQASCNYAVGKDGSIGLCVEEKDRSWCSSNAANDHRAITIEVASDTTHPYAVTDAAYNALIELVTDICKRNGIKKLLWQGNKSLIGQVDKQNMTVHRWFANKACPGDYLYNRHSDIANKVNAKLGASSSSSTSTSTSSTNTKFPAVPFTVNVLISDLNYRSAGSMSGTVKGQTGKGVFTITEVNSAGWGKLKSGAGWIYLGNSAYVSIGSTVSSSSKSTSTNTSSSYLVKVTTDALNIRKGPGTSYDITGCIRDKGTYTIVETSGNWGRLKSGAGWICLTYTQRI